MTFTCSTVSTHRVVPKTKKVFPQFWGADQESKAKVAGFCLLSLFKVVLCPGPYIFFHQIKFFQYF